GAGVGRLSQRHDDFDRRHHDPGDAAQQRHDDRRHDGPTSASLRRAWAACVRVLLQPAGPLLRQLELRPLLRAARTLCVCEAQHDVKHDVKAGRSVIVFAPRAVTYVTVTTCVTRLRL
ncbi:hypothetical protein EMIHUDRAFT_436244, partial [Emiliania huxleyi CCMP1516]|uniref:Uncharacterized protein n=2 Tax=Emiliania huxleyi TaxID=2903 RepID=A0A0D3J2J8_EMIH1